MRLPPAATTGSGQLFVIGVIRRRSHHYPTIRKAAVTVNLLACMASSLVITLHLTAVFIPPATASDLSTSATEPSTTA